MSRLRRKQEAQLVLACTPIEEALEDVKTAHAVEGSEESRAAKRAQMATLHETRVWLRAKHELDTLPGMIASLEQQLKSARLAKDGKAGERVARLERKVTAGQARLARIQAQCGPLVQAMNELAAGGA